MTFWKEFWSALGLWTVAILLLWATFALSGILLGPKTLADLPHLAASVPEIVGMVLPFTGFAAAAGVHLSGRPLRVDPGRALLLVALGGACAGVAGYGLRAYASPLLRQVVAGTTARGEVSGAPERMVPVNAMTPSMLRDARAAELSRMRGRKGSGPTLADRAWANSLGLGLHTPVAWAALAVLMVVIGAVVGEGARVGRAREVGILEAWCAGLVLAAVLGITAVFARELTLNLGAAPVLAAWLPTVLAVVVLTPLLWSRAVLERSRGTAER